MLYDFYCPMCKKDITLEMSMHDYSLTGGHILCVECGSKLHRVYGPVQFNVPRGKMGNARNGYRDEVYDMVYGEGKDK